MVVGPPETAHILVNVWARLIAKKGNKPSMARRPSLCKVILKQANSNREKIKAFKYRPAYSQTTRNWT
jgi:hypothetical protein